MKKEFDIINDAPNEVDDMQAEYDFSGGVRGKYYRPGKTIIRMTIDETWRDTSIRQSSSTTPFAN